MVNRSSRVSWGASLLVTKEVMPYLFACGGLVAR